MAGIFGDLDVAAAATDPFKVDDGTYEATLTKAEVKESQKGNTGLALTYTITSEGDMNGRNISEWKNIPTPADPKNPTKAEATAASFLKQRIVSLGIPENKINTMQPEDLIGIDVVVTVAEKDGYTNIKKLVLAGGDSGSVDW